MPQVDLIRLDWFRCLDGYRIEDRADPPVPLSAREKRLGLKKPRRSRLLAGIIAGRYIVGNSTRRDPTTPLRCVGLYRWLAKVSDDDSALAFCKNHGLLCRGKEQRVDEVLDAAADMRGLIAAIDKKRWGALADTLRRAGQDNRIFEIGGIGRLGAVFDWQEGMERPALFYRPGNLLGAIYLQALQDASGGAELRKCDRPGCPAYFQVGPGTRRPRLDRGVTYCTPKCQKAHAYMKKKGVSK